MEALTGGPENYIFYLQLSDELQDEYFQLSLNLKRWGISLVPVLPHHLSKMTEKDRHHLICYVPDHRSYERYRAVFKQYLKLGIISKKYCLYELSSFPKNEEAHIFERLRSFYQFRLPVDGEEVVKSIVRQFYLEKQDNRRWPGTKRGRLPSLVIGQ